MNDVLPLDGASVANPTQGGYEYLQWSSHQNGYHEGIDLNCGVGIDGDLGAPLLSLTKMRLAYSGVARGFGNHQWWEVIDGSDYQGAYVHYAHANEFIYSDVDTVVERGDAIGTCGKSGNQYAAHLHFVVAKSWLGPTYYGGPSLTVDEVRAATHDPIEFWSYYNERTEANHMEVTEQERELIQKVRDTNYPVTEATRLIEQAAGLGSNADSIAGWINQIGALEEQVRVLSEHLKPQDELQSEPQA